MVTIHINPVFHISEDGSEIIDLEIVHFYMLLTFLIIQRTTRSIDFYNI